MAHCKIRLSERSGSLGNEAHMHLDVQQVYHRVQAKQLRIACGRYRYLVCESSGEARKVYVWDLEGNTASVVASFPEANWPSPETGRKELHTHFTPDGALPVLVRPGRHVILAALLVCGSHLSCMYLHAAQQTLWSQAQHFAMMNKIFSGVSCPLDNLNIQIHMDWWTSI